MRAGIAAGVFSLLLCVFCSPLAAQTNPIPYLHSPLVPGATLPGGPGFTLTVNGAGFVPGAVVRWNDSARATTFVSNTKVTAAILASDIVTPGTIFVTVSNPAPGGGISNSVFFEVTTPTASLTFSRADNDFSNGATSVAGPLALTVQDLTNDGYPALAIANSSCPLDLTCIRDKAAITVVAPGSFFDGQVTTTEFPGSISSGDFNGDGLLDLITLNGSSFSIFINGSVVENNAVPAGCSLSVGFDAFIALGDFNQDGRLDVALTGSSGGICVLPGNGDGTFGTPINSGSGTFNAVLAVGDFNGDGKLDLIVSSTAANTISILLGNGDGTFQLPVAAYSTGPYAGGVVTGDFNGDGKLDFALVNTPNVSIFPGNGDGTFKPNVDYAAGIDVDGLIVGDYNGDGVIDLAVADGWCGAFTCPASGSVNVLLGNGDGTFQNHVDFANGGLPGAIVTGDFGSLLGRPGFAVANPQDNTVSLLVAIPSGPVISSFSPTSAPMNTPGFVALTVNGSNFESGDQLYFGATRLPTTFVSATQLAATIQATDLNYVGSVYIAVLPGDGISSSNVFTVYGPTPTISSLNPPSLVEGGPATTLDVIGTNFFPGATANFNGIARPTTFISSTELSITISAADIASQAPISLSVTTPAVNGYGGGTSGSLPLTILPTNTQPVVGSLVPASTTAGGPAFTLTLLGSGFTASSVVAFNSNVVSSVFFVGEGELEATIPAGAIAAAGTPLVTVANPGGSPSVALTFTVNNPVPTASSLSPLSLPVGSAATTVNVTGTNFNASSAVLVNGTPRVTTLVSSALLSAALLASDFAHGGTLNITVNSPAPGGGTSSTLVFTVVDSSMPTISLLTPSLALVNSGAFTLTINGTNFVSGATVYFGNQPRATTFVSSTQLSAAVQPADLANVGSVGVYVMNPPPGGGNAASSAFSVYGPAPGILTLSPSSVVAGGPAFTLMINGLNFFPVTTVNFNNAVRPTTFVSSTQLSIAITIGDIASQGTINISVTTPSVNGNGGGTSGTLPFSVLPTNTQPVVGALVPASATAGGPAFTLTLAGSGFTASSVVTFNSSVVSSAFVSASQLQATIPASAIVVGGTPFVSVTNPGGVPSLLVTFTVNNPVPSASNLSPSSLPAGNAAATVNITGANFNASSTVQVNNSPRATTYVSTTSLNAALLGSDFASSGTLNIRVNNPAPAGGTSSTLTFTVEDFRVNVQTPATSVPAGQPASFSFMVVPANTTTSNSVTFSVSGLPVGATPSFSPSATVPAGSGTTPVTLSIATTAHSGLPAFKLPRMLWPRGVPLYLASLLMVLMWLGLRGLYARVPRLAPQFLLVGLLVIAGTLVACSGGGVSTTSLNPATGTPAGTYSITVTATSGSGSVSNTVMLTVM